MTSAGIAALVAVLALGFIEGLRRFYPSRETWRRLRRRRGSGPSARCVSASKRGRRVGSQAASSNSYSASVILWIAVAGWLDKEWYEVALDALPYIFVLIAILRTPGTLFAIGERMKEYEKEVGEDPDAEPGRRGGPPEFVSVSFDARLYLVAPARLAAGELHALVPELVDAGVDAIQLREKEMEAGDLTACCGADPRTMSPGPGVPFILNDRPGRRTSVLGADGVHVGQNDLPVEHVRRPAAGTIVGTLNPRRGRGRRARTVKPSTTSPSDRCYETPTKPGRPSVGLGLVRYAAASTLSIRGSRSVGSTRRNIERYWGPARARIVVVRAITEAGDPPAAAARFAAPGLDGVDR